jgi:hypothetical protein
MKSLTTNRKNSKDCFQNGQTILVINRWNDDFSKYHEYIDHTKNKVIYLTTPSGRKAVREDLAACIYELVSLTDKPRLLECCKEVILCFGSIDKIIALSEYDLESAAFLRDELRLKGINSEQVKLYKDKVVMKRRLHQKGLRVPSFIECNNPADVISFCERVNYPLMLKPKVGAASQGVYRVLSNSEMLPLLKSIGTKVYECEEYVPGTVLHIDGLVNNQEIIFFKASKYINTCLAFNYGIPLGSVIIDDVVFNKRIRDFTAEILEGLELSDSAFHLELIHSESNELVFLELNARVGGGEIPFLIRDLFSIDLVASWVRIQMQDNTPNHISDGHEVGGWLMIPEPQQVPCKVISCPSLIGRVPYLYREIIPKKGDIFDGQGGFEHISGRFYFKGQSSKEVEQGIFLALSLFEINTSPITSE